MPCVKWPLCFKGGYDDKNPVCTPTDCREGRFIF